jgi:hypothetical protein
MIHCNECNMALRRGLWAAAVLFLPAITEAAQKYESETAGKSL